MSQIHSDVLPKTDFTYARSGSYSPRHLHDKYTTPNMSRRNLREGMTPSNSLLHDVDSDSDGSESRFYQYKVTERGMLLRSGAQLTRQQQLQAEREGSRHRTTSAVLVNDAQMVEGNTPLSRHRWSQGAAQSAHGESYATTTVTKTYEVLEDSNDQTDSSHLGNHRTRSQARGTSWYSSRTEEQIERERMEREEEGRRLEKEEMEREEERRISREHQQKDGVRLKHMFDLDQTDDFSDIDDIDLKSSKSGAWGAERNGITSSRFFLFIMKIVTTVTEYSYSAVKTVATPVWTQMLAPVVNPVVRMISWIDEHIRSVFGYFILVDAWVLSRISRWCCCLCLPLLLLLPLLGAGGYYLYRTDLVAYNETAFIHKAEELHTINLHYEVKQILVQLRKEERRDWLTKPEIEALVQGLLDSQMESLRVSMLTIIQEGNTHQEALKVSQEEARQRLNAMETQMAGLLAKVKEETVNTLTMYNELKTNLGKQDWLTRSEIEALVQGMLNLQIETLRLDLLSIAKGGSTGQGAVNVTISQDDARLRLAAMEAQIAELLDKAKNKNLDQDVQLILLQLEKDGKHNWLTRSEIEDLVRGLLTSQMESLRLNLLSIVQEGSTDQKALKTSHEDARLRLDTMQKQMTDLLDKTKMENLHYEVEQILLRLQKDEKLDWLTRSEIEDLVKGLLTSHMESVQLSLATTAKEGSTGQETLRESQEEARLRLDVMEKQIADLLNKVKTKNLHEEVQLILLQLQKEEKADWLTRSQIEVLVQGLLTPQLESLRLSLAATKDGSADQETLVLIQEDARLRLATLEKQMSELLDKANQSEGDLSSLKDQLLGIINAMKDSLEDKLRTQQDNWEDSLKSERQKWEGRMASIEVTISDLKAMIESLPSTNVDLVAFSKKCCMDEGALLATIREEVNRILAGRGISQDGASGISVEDVQRITAAALLKFTADKTGLPDYALESAGGSIVNIRCSKTYTKRAATMKIWGFPIYYVVNGPRTVIQPEVLPGNCWPFEGDQGFLVIQLAVPIRPTSFALEHIEKSLSIYGDSGSAPKDFSVIGLASETDVEGVTLGKYKYDAEGTPLQHFDVQADNPGIFHFVEMRIHSNYGNKEYTCLYRFRVHGIPQEQQR